MVVVAIVGVLAALASTSLAGVQRQARASGEARLIVYRLQSARTLSVSQGWPQGYYFGGPGDGNAALMPLAWCLAAGCGFTFEATAPPLHPPTQRDLVKSKFPFDALPYVAQGALGFTQILSVQAKGVGAASFTVGFDLNGLPQINPPPIPLVFPICLSVQDIRDPATLRWVLVFSDGTTRIQKVDETYCF